MKKLKKDDKTRWQMPMAEADSQGLAWQRCQVQSISELVECRGWG